MSVEIRFFIEGQLIDPASTEVVNPVVTAVANTAILQTMGKQGLTNPTNIEVVAGVEHCPVFYVQSWHETNTEGSKGRLQVTETDFNLHFTGQRLGIITEHDSYFGLTDAQANCLTALACTAIIGEEFGRWTPPHWLPGIN